MKNSPDELTIPSDHSFEFSYTNQVSIKHRKVFGQFFTPISLANAMATWLNEINPKVIVDPAVGTGVLLKACRDLDSQVKLVGVDLDPGPIKFAKARFYSDAHTEFRVEDFIENLDLQNLEAVTCNPPYVRHHLLEYPELIRSQLGSEISGLSGTTNLYVLFLASIMSRLAKGGRASILLPGDWMNSNFGRSIREYLANGKECARIIYFSNDSQPFDDAETTATLLLFERGRSSFDVEVVVVGAEYDRDNAGALALERLEDIQNASCHRILWTDLDPSQKWDVLIRNEFVDVPSHWIPLGNFAKCTRGIATGANDYFLVSEDRLLEESLPIAENIPCIGRARDVKGLVFTSDDFELLDSSVPKYLVNLQSASFDTSRYIELGESQGLPSRYLLSKRTPWYKLEDRDPADIWVGVFGRDGIRFIWNQNRIKNLTTFHGVYLSDHHEDIDTTDTDLVPAIVAALNSTRVQEKAREFQRAYGGGLQKVEPRDVPQLLLPDLFALSQADKRKLAKALSQSDSLIKERKLNWRLPIDKCMESILD